MPDTFSQAKIDDLLQQLNTSATQGLAADVAAQRLSLRQKSVKTPSRFQREVKLFISQFTNPLVLLLVVAVVLSAFLGQATDTLIIVFILLANGLMGFWQELNAGRAVEQLQQMIKLRSSVIRNGKESEIPIEEIVPGDVIVLNAGDIIPADCRLIEDNELHVNESSITGESYPVEKAPAELPDDTPIAQKSNCLWQGTNVVSGTAKALVVNTGKDTVFGQMAHSLTKSEETAFEKGIKRFGYFLMQVTIILAVVILSVNIYFKRPLFESILFALAIAVGMAPELLPAIMTFAMSAGARRMLKKKVIVKKLSSIFNFGEVNILCTDKTGTITEGTIKVKEVVNSYGKPDDKIKLYAFLNASFQNGFSNPIDEALKQIDSTTNDYTKVDEIPYDFIRKRLSIVVSNNAALTMITKGAVDNILDICTKATDEQGNIVDLNKDAIKQYYTNYCSNGARLIAVCYKPITDN
ncbi:MAG: HAD-IC family P-type ATPase, partial [Flavipsychrobacter sp.]